MNDSRPRVLGADLVDNAATIFHCRSNKVRAAAARLVPRQVPRMKCVCPVQCAAPKEHPLVGPRGQALLVGVHGRLRHTVGPGVRSRTVADLAQAHDARIQLHALNAPHLPGRAGCRPRGWRPGSAGAGYVRNWQPLQIPRVTRWSAAWSLGCAQKKTSSRPGRLRNEWPRSGRRRETGRPLRLYGRPLGGRKSACPNAADAFAYEVTVK